MPEPPPPAPPQPTAPPKPRRSRWRRLLRWALYLLIFVAIFHRPLILTTARLALIQVASKQNVTLNVHFSGTIFTNLTVSGVQALPNGKGKTPVEKIAIEEIHLEYSIPNLIRHGVGEFLHSYEVKNAEIVIVGDGSKAPEDKQQKKSLAEDLNNLLGQPALYADLVRIENFNFTLRTPTDTTEVKGVSLFLHPWEPGYLRIARISAPGVPVWENLSAETSYANRNLYLKGLQLAPELEIEEYNFDASQRTSNTGSMLVKARVFGGHLLLGLAGTQLNKKGENLQQSYDTKLRVEAAGIDLQAAAAYFKAPAPPVARLAWLKTTFTGEPEHPRTWKGESGVRVEGIAAGPAKIDFAEIDSTFADGVARITSTQVVAGRTALSLTGQAQLPESVNDFARTEGDAAFTLTAPALDELTKPFVPQPIEGAIAGSGKVGMHQRRVVADVDLTATQVHNPDLSLGAAVLKLHVTKALDQPADASALDGLDGKVSAELHEVRYATFATDSATLEAESHNERVQLTKLEIVRAENSVSAKGTYQVPQPGRPPAPIQGEFAIQAPKLESFGIGQEGRILSGHLSGNGKVQALGDHYSGKVSLDGGDFEYAGFKAASFAARIGVEKNEATIEQFALRINATDQIALTGKAGVQAPFAYEGAALIVFKDLAVLQPLLAAFGLKDPVGGALDFSVESNGQIQPLAPGGKMELKLTKAKYGAVKIDEVGLAALFGPQYAETSQLKVVMGETSFEGGLEWRDNRLRLKDINLRQGSQQALTGFVLLPFEPQNAEGPIPLEKRVAVNVNANQLDVEKLLASLGLTAPVAGVVSANLVLGGTLLDPAAHLKVVARNLRSKAAAQLKPAEFDLTAHYSGKDLTLDASAREPDIQPLTIKGHFPLDVEAMARAKKLDPNLPLDLTVKLPPSSLAFVTGLVPAVRSVAGTAAIDAHVSGTVEKPQWGGSVALKLDYARLKNDSVPGIGKLDIGLAFTQDALTVQRFRGEVGGGSFDLGGKIGLAKLTEPVFDLRLKSNSILVKRDDSITVRVDSDITVAGPMAAGKLAGTVWVTQSRFFKDLDILPIALPGRPKPKPKPEPRSVASDASFSLPPPLDKWTFDLAIKTRPNDPFKIVGNLANGAAAIDLKFGGTGAKPELEGSVRVEKLVASLPFSKLEIQRGFITFTKDAFAEPKLEIFAESNMRDYHINAYIYGSAKDPQLSLTSEPPLPQQDIISLIATGTTTAELSGGGDVLASRAAIIVFQQLYHKVFKKKQTTETDSARDRFSFDAGAVDSRSGRQEISASFRLGDQTYLVGDVNVAGQFTGRIRYLLRYR